MIGHSCDGARLASPDHDVRRVAERSVRLRERDIARDFQTVEHVLGGHGAPKARYSAARGSRSTPSMRSQACASKPRATAFDRTPITSSGASGARRLPMTSARRKHVSPNGHRRMMIKAMRVRRHAHAGSSNRSGEVGAPSLGTRRRTAQHRVSRPSRAGCVAGGSTRPSPPHSTRPPPPRGLSVERVRVFAAVPG